MLALSKMSLAATGIYTLKVVAIRYISIFGLFDKSVFSDQTLSINLQWFNNTERKSGIGGHYLVRGVSITVCTSGLLFLDSNRS